MQPVEQQCDNDTAVDKSQRQGDRDVRCMVACAPCDQQRDTEDQETHGDARRIREPRHEQLSRRRPGKCQHGDGGNDSGGTGREHEYSTERKSWRCHVLPWLEVRHIIRGVASVCHQRHRKGTKTGSRPRCNICLRIDRYLSNRKRAREIGRGEGILQVNAAPWRVLVRQTGDRANLKPPNDVDWLVAGRTERHEGARQTRTSRLQPGFVRAQLVQAKG